MKMSNTLLKTLSYALMHMTIAIILAYIVSGSWKIAFAIGLLEPCVQTVAFYFHERMWHKREHRYKLDDHHDNVIDSVSPVTGLVEKILTHKH